MYNNPLTVDTHNGSSLGRSLGFLTQVRTRRNIWRTRIFFSFFFLPDRTQTNIYACHSLCMLASPTEKAWSQLQLSIMYTSPTLLSHACADGARLGPSEKAGSASCRNPVLIDVRVRLWMHLLETPWRAHKLSATVYNITQRNPPPPPFFFPVCCSLRPFDSSLATRRFSVLALQLHLFSPHVHPHCWR